MALPESVPAQGLRKIGKKLLQQPFDLCGGGVSSAWRVRRRDCGGLWWLGRRSLLAWLCHAMRVAGWRLSLAAAQLLVLLLSEVGVVASAGPGAHGVLEGSHVLEVTA